MPFDYRTDDPLRLVSASRAKYERPPSLRFLVVKESAQNASQDEWNRALVDDNTVRLCRRGHECDSTLRCVTCSVYRMAERQATLAAALRVAPAAVMVSLTFRHDTKPLAEEWSDLDAILVRFTKRGDWSHFKKQHGITGYAVTEELTKTSDGWNVHSHVILTFDQNSSPAGRRRLQQAVTARWVRAARHLGHDAAEHLQTFSWMRDDLSADDMAEYVTKQTLLKRAPETKLGRYPGDLLAGAHAGDADDLLAYREYLDAARHRGLVRQYGTLSRNADTAHVRLDPPTSESPIDFDKWLASGRG
ncbi:hypothetical protein [Microbacterium trichothecenolyticum]|uniref:hypothetical protein n=1 Tax=Microbacterium trichothecenolyticum TaxID=69370 RepID=UPI0027D7AD58|nr:hypothetical protein [Microbacterium trichothecenolyticum]